MSLQLNKVFVAGRLTRTPELKEGQKTNWCNVGIAVNRGKERDEVDFFDVTLFGKAAESLCAMAEKGTPIFIEGRLTANRKEVDGGKVRVYYGIAAYSWSFIESKREDTAKVAATPGDAETSWDDVPF
jgi:single-strand DNA-binding protein